MAGAERRGVLQKIEGLMASHLKLIMKTLAFMLMA